MKANIEIKAVAITLAIVLLLGGISIYFFGEYGWLVFAFLPFLIGFLPPFIVSQSRYISKKQALGLSSITLGFSFIGLLLFAIEGLICILMASPLVCLLTLLSSYISVIFQSKKPTNTIGLLLLASITLMSFDVINDSNHLLAVKTQVTVDTDIQTVWEHVVTFDKIDTPNDWIFKTGISYPTDATIDGTGVGAIRYCNFSTGSFVEPITTWDAPHLLQFDVQEQPIPMNELNPFWDVHPPHLEGYFQSQKGQFKLTEIDKQTTLLEGTTWYQVDIAPQRYWQLWTDFIIHRIHQRVLNHIKDTAEEQ